MPIDTEVNENALGLTDAFLDGFLAVAEYAANVVASIVDAMASLVEYAVDVVASVVNACYSAYEAVGAPYGRDMDGMFQWIDERLAEFEQGANDAG